MTERIEANDRAVRVGVDVGGTHTDAVVLRGASVLGACKVPTTDDVSTGVVTAVGAVLQQASCDTTQVDAMMIGTTHYLNALTTRRGLDRVGALRLCGPTSQAYPPMFDWPSELREAVDGGAALVAGGFEYDGRPIAALDEGAIRHACARWRMAGVTAVAVCGVFAFVDPRQELRAAEIVEQELPGARVSVSHRIGHAGLLRRENATLLNASLTALSVRTIDGFLHAFAAIGLRCRLYLTQNDGTVMSAAHAQMFPVLAIASGPTNSIRGAALLAGVSDAVVIDVGGTTTDVGVLSGGFPRTRTEGAEIAGVRTGFRVPDVLSVGVGGGSVVRSTDGELTVGPDSVGHRLPQEAKSFGGQVLTASDLAVRVGQAQFGDAGRLADLDGETARLGLEVVAEQIDDLVDRVKPSADPLPAIVVGGGSVLLGRELANTSGTIVPDHHGVANAIGAATAQISGEAELVVSLDSVDRSVAVHRVIDVARQRAVDAGASADGIEVVDVHEVPLSYMPGRNVQLAVRVLGEALL